ncbi:MAG: MotB family protein [Pseudomonadota bacterium]
MVEEEDDGPAGTPAWMATFADLMSLLMCFFVLLLSFSEMDVQKFKEMAGSMALAFGVQQQFELDSIPKGTSVIALEFSPGKTVDTIEETIQQVTDDQRDQSIRVGENAITEAELEAQLEAKVAELIEETAADAEKLEELLAEEIDEGKVDVETEGRTIKVRIREKGSFPSGSATLATDFIPVIDKIRNSLVEIPGTVAIEGHTDNVPIRRGRYKTNWALASGRALSVTHELLKNNVLDDERMMVVGFADTQPFTSNDTSDGRASNRRVEIVIRQRISDEEADELDQLRDVNPDALKVLGID